MLRELMIRAAETARIETYTVRKEERGVRTDTATFVSVKDDHHDV